MRKARKFQCTHEGEGISFLKVVRREGGLENSGTKGLAYSGMYTTSPFPFSIGDCVFLIFHVLVS
jgi:hypothetical protein